MEGGVGLHLQYQKLILRSLQFDLPLANVGPSSFPDLFEDRFRDVRLDNNIVVSRHGGSDIPRCLPRGQLSYRRSNSTASHRREPRSRIPNAEINFLLQLT